jgi:hypothetical protein
MLYVFRRGSSSWIIGDDSRCVNIAMRTLENRFYYFFSQTHTPSLFFFYISRLPKAVFGQSFPFQRDIFNHNSCSMGTALNTVSLCNRTVLTGLTSFTARLLIHTHAHKYACASASPSLTLSFLLLHNTHKYDRRLKIRSTSVFCR